MRVDLTATNTSDILSISVSEAYNTPSTSAVITAKTTSLNLGDIVQVYTGYDGDLVKIFRGYVKIKEKVVPDNVYTITAYDELIKATDFFIASATPDSQYSELNVSAEELVHDMLDMASITDYSHDTSYFTFGITYPVEVNLITSYDMCKTIADILAWHLWADTSGTVHFKDRKPYVMPEDTSVKTITVPSLTRISHRVSDRDLRNRVVVYGFGDVNVVRQESSIYLPAGFFKSVVVASPWIDDMEMAEAAAEWNLDKLNRLTEEVSMEIIGDPELHVGDVVTIEESYTGVTGDWLIFSCEHNISTDGFRTSMELRK